MKTEELHHIHKTFMLNLSRAAGKPFEESAKEWRIERIARSKESLHCQVCSTRLNQYVVLMNAENRNRVLIGLDCYDKLINYLRTGEIESSLRERHSFTHELRMKCAEILHETVAAWLFEELHSGRLRAELVPLVEQVKDFGFAPSIEDANQLVDYYKNHRRMFIERLVPECRSFRHRKLLPNHIPIAATDRVLKIVERGNQIRAKLAKSADIKHREWNKLLTLNTEVMGMMGFGKQEPVITEELSLIREEIARLISQFNSCNLVERIPQNVRELEAWVDGLRHLCWEKIRVYKSTEGAYYIQPPHEDTWVRVSDIDLLGTEHIRSSGVYEAFVSWRDNQMFITPQHADLSDCGMVKFDIPDVNNPYDYIGALVSKIKVIPIDPVPWGTYMILKVKKQRKYWLVHAV